MCVCVRVCVPGDPRSVQLGDSTTLQGSHKVYIHMYLYFIEHCNREFSYGKLGPFFGENTVLDRLEPSP